PRLRPRRRDARQHLPARPRSLVRRCTSLSDLRPPPGRGAAGTPWLGSPVLLQSPRGGTLGHRGRGSVRQTPPRPRVLVPRLLPPEFRTPPGRPSQRRLALAGESDGLPGPALRR